MPMTRIAMVGAGLLSLVLAVAPVEARQRRGVWHGGDFGLNPSVGRNAPEAIGHGLAGMATGWIDTMANFYANPSYREGDYFDDYRRRPYEPRRSARR